MSSLERIRDYVSIEQEPKSTEAGIPPAYWPASGDLRVENLSAKYSPVCTHGIMCSLLLDPFLRMGLRYFTTSPLLFIAEKGLALVCVAV